MYLDAGDARLYFEERGSGPPLLCLHAFPVDGTVWRRQAPLAEQARLIVPDLRGVGRSTGPAAPARMESLAGDMIALLDHLAIERAAVMGLSLGGYVAFALCRLYPERVRALILADTRAEADAPEARERRLRMAEAFLAQGPAPALDMLPNLFGATTEREHPDLVEEERRHAEAAHAEGLAMLQRGMAERPDATPLLPEIAVPALVLCGEEDAVSPPEGMRALAGQIPGARFRLIPRAGHLSPLENPEAFNREVEAFLGEL